VISWASIAYGTALTAVAAAVAVALTVRERQGRVLAAAALAAAAGPLAWNAILRDTGGAGFFVDAPLALIPASWQDTGSGVFATSTSVILLGLGPRRTTRAGRLAATAAICGVAAFLIDVYLY
jgi:hypothetical protein